MIPFDVLFNGKQVMRYNEKVIHRYYKIDVAGEYVIKFRYISKNSKFNQAIVLLFDGFVGKFYISNEEIMLPKIRFPKQNFWMETAPKEFEVKIQLTEGIVLVCNGSDPLGTRKICHTLHMGCAIYIENIDEHIYRFHCNDHENDDDFDDLIFDMMITDL